MTPGRLHTEDILRKVCIAYILQENSVSLKIKICEEVDFTYILDITVVTKNKWQYFFQSFQF